MPAALAQVDATAAQAAAADAGARVSALLRSVTHPSAPALGDWDVTDVAVHLSHVVDLVGAMVKGTESMTSDIWDLSRLTTMLVAGESERDLNVLATRVDAGVANLLAAARANTGESQKWLVEGVRMPLPTLVCHALNELVVHGRDIAKADGVPWPIERTEATLVLRGFLFPVVGALGGAMVDDAAAGVTATYCIHLRGDGRVVFHLEDGALHVTDELEGTKVDCHLSVDPAAFLLVAWGRLSQWPAIGRGQLLAWGRKPWLGLKLRSMMRNP